MGAARELAGAACEGDGERVQQGEAGQACVRALTPRRLRARLQPPTARCHVLGEGVWTPQDLYAMLHVPRGMLSRKLPCQRRARAMSAACQLSRMRMECVLIMTHVGRGFATWQNLGGM